MGKLTYDTFSSMVPLVEPRPRHLRLCRATRPASLYFITKSYDSLGYNKVSCVTRKIVI